MFVLSAGEYFLQMKQYIKHMQTSACWSCLGWGWSPMDECGQSHSTLFLFWCIFPGSHHKMKKSNRSNTRTENKQTNKQTKTSQMALGQRLFPGGSHGQESACSVGDPGSIPWSGRSPGEGNGYPLQYSCPENRMDRGTWWASGHGVFERGTGLSD